MANIIKLLEKDVNGLKVNLFEYNICSKDSVKEIRDYLIKKIKKSKVHSITGYDWLYSVSKNLKKEYVDKFKEQVIKMSIPKKAIIPQFDVRRERVTEWIAQYLLEQEFGCMFYDEADKRINLKSVEIDKHTDGIDVPGIRMINNKINFVVCEVKASESNKIPCEVMDALQKDIQKSIDNEGNRLTREIRDYMDGIKDVQIQDELLKNIVKFLMRLIAGEKEELIDNTAFFSFLIRKNSEIVLNKNVDDFKNFSLSRVKKNNVENIILAFEKQFSDFSTTIYNEAIGE